jgi:hypothetical protein
MSCRCSMSSRRSHCSLLPFAVHSGDRIGIHWALKVPNGFRNSGSTGALLILFLSETPNSEQHSVEESLWSGRTFRNVNVHGQDLVYEHLQSTSICKPGLPGAG